MVRRVRRTVDRMPCRPRITLPPPPDHPRDLPATSVHRPHIITSTAFSAWHNGRYPQQVDAVGNACAPAISRQRRPRITCGCSPQAGSMCSRARSAAVGSGGIRSSTRRRCRRDRSSRVDESVLKGLLGRLGAPPPEDVAPEPEATSKGAVSPAGPSTSSHHDPAIERCHALQKPRAFAARSNASVACARRGLVARSQSYAQGYRPPTRSSVAAPG